MRAYIEYPEISRGRLPVHGELYVRTAERAMVEAINTLGLPVENIDDVMKFLEDEIT